MLLCLDIGNTQIFAGVLRGDEIILRFRLNTKRGDSSDQIGIFLKNVLRENSIKADEITDIALCSVVPHIDYSVISACLKYFNLQPFILKAGVKTGLKIHYRNPTEVGSDRISNAIAATHQYPNQPLIIVDFGTATTLCAIGPDRDYYGGVIVPGMRLSIEALQAQAAKLSSVEIIKPEHHIGRTPAESMQIGLYTGQYALIREVTHQICQHTFQCDREKVMVIGTGGFVHLFNDTHLFDAVEPDLVLKGLCLAYKLNQARVSA